ncbi:MAG: cupin domain-containing protein [Candidatus Moraniibacteriota bacterium]
MRKPFKKSLNEIPIEEAHGGTGSRQLLLSKIDPISKYLEAMTKGYLKAGRKFDWHLHDEIDEFFLVIKGHGLVEFKNENSLEYSEGDLIYIPANIEHQIIASKDGDNEFFFIRLQGK